MGVTRLGAVRCLKNGLLILTAVGSAATGAADVSGQTPQNATNANRFAEKRIPYEAGFRVYIVPDMEGMGTVVSSRETTAGNEGPRFADRSSPDYWDHYRHLYTAEVNAVIAGARASGARSFVINEGHGGNMFASILPWELDPDAQLIRGFPRPNVMSTAVDSTFGTMMFTGAHSSAGSGGVMSHMYAFSRFTINGRPQNETTFNSLVAGEQGVSTSLVAGDDQLVRETKEWLGNGVIGVVVKTAVGGSAAITWSPARVQQMLRDSAQEAVRRERAGDFKPYVLERPYQVEIRLSSSSEAIIRQVDALMPRFNLTKGEDARSYRMSAQRAVDIGYLFDAIETIVLRAPANPPTAAQVN